VAQLRLDHNEIGDVGAWALAGALTINDTLQTLWLDDNEIGTEGATALAKALTANHTLTEVCPGHDCRLDHVHAWTVAACAQLTLNRSALDDAGASALAGMLAVNSTLQGLQLSDNSVGDAGASALAKALASNRALREACTQWAISGQSIVRLWCAASFGQQPAKRCGRVCVCRGAHSQQHTSNIVTGWLPFDWRCGRLGVGEGPGRQPWADDGLSRHTTGAASLGAIHEPVASDCSVWAQLNLYFDKLTDAGIAAVIGALADNTTLTKVCVRDGAQGGV